jgi:hypothetical protein
VQEIRTPCSRHDARRLSVPPAVPRVEPLHFIRAPPVPMSLSVSLACSRLRDPSPAHLCRSRRTLQLRPCVADSVGFAAPPGPARWAALFVAAGLAAICARPVPLSCQPSETQTVSEAPQPIADLTLWPALRNLQKSGLRRLARGGQLLSGPTTGGAAGKKKRPGVETPGLPPMYCNLQCTATDTWP